MHCVTELMVAPQAGGWSRWFLVPGGLVLMMLMMLMVLMAFMVVVLVLMSLRLLQAMLSPVFKSAAARAIIEEERKTPVMKKESIHLVGNYV